MSGRATVGLPRRLSVSTARRAGLPEGSLMIVTVSIPPAARGRSRVWNWATRMSELAARMPGYISHKVFVAPDGERVTLVEFASEEAQRAWSRHPDHVAAQKKGRQDFYVEYRLQVCRVERESVFPLPEFCFVYFPA
jgi:heme-degrading monooxygenase HmoA